MLPNKAYVIGAGPIGLCLAGALSRFIPTSLICKDKKKLFPEFLIKENPGDLFGQVSIGQLSWQDALLDKTPALYVLATKAYDLESVLKSLVAQLNQATPLLITSNGLGLAADAKAILDSKVPIYRLLINFGAAKLDPHSIQRFGEAQAILGTDSLDQDLTHELLKFFSKSGIKISSVETLERAEWIKSLVNSSVNTICTIAERENGALISDPLLNSLARKVFGEVRELAKNNNIDLSDISDDQILKGIEQHAANYNSTLRGAWQGEQLDESIFLLKRLFNHKQQSSDTTLSLLYALLQAKLKTKK